MRATADDRPGRIQRIRALEDTRLTAPIEDYRTLMSAFPTGVAVITTVHPDGNPCGITCSSLSSVTLDPPTLLVCIKLGSYTLSALSGRGSFLVNLLHTRGRRAAEVFASPEPERFSRVSWRPFRSTGLPWLAEDAFALAECRVAGMVEVGDHMVVLGEVVETAFTSDTPLLYGMRRFSSWPADTNGDQS